MPIAHQDSRWPGERRAGFLIRPEIESPISVNPGVWPVLARNPDENYPLHLWGSVSEILAAFPDAGHCRSDSPAIVEIAAQATDGRSSAYWEGIPFGRVGPEDDSAAYAVDIPLESLGYDIANRYLVSGLSNCMLSPDELAVIRRDWSRAINPWGLFDDSGLATAYAAACDRLIPEHAPFETYRIRRIRIRTDS